jgi:formate dehydrogenase subunit delta
MSTITRLVYMANQIAKNFATEADPAAATAEHIRLFWDPRMKRLIVGARGLDPVAEKAIAALTSQAAM